MGVYVSGHPLSRFMEEMKSFSLTADMIQPKEQMENAEGYEEETLDDPDGLKDGDEVTCGGIITECKKLYSKRDGKEMGVLKVEDIYGTLDVMLFSRQFAMFKHLLAPDSIIKIKGKLSINDRGTTVLAENISLMTDIDSKEDKKEVKEEYIPTLYLKYDLTDTELSNDILESLKSYPGKSPVIVKCSVQNKPFKLPVTVNTKGFLINELHAYIEDKFIVVK